MEKIKLHIDTVKYNSKPTESAATIKNRLQKDTAPVEVTISELLDKLNDGYTISPGVMQGGAKSENINETYSSLFGGIIEKSFALEKFDKNNISEI